jgi:hypothetical protein
MKRAVLVIVLALSIAVAAQKAAGHLSNFLRRDYEKRLLEKQKNEKTRNER